MTEPRVGRRLIYGIIDPRTQTLFYVGKTHKRRELRLNEHVERVLEGRSTPISQRIREVLGSGSLPVIFILRRLPPAISWQGAERAEIAFWRSVRADKLPYVHPPQSPKSVPVVIASVDLVNVQAGG